MEKLVRGVHEFKNYYFKDNQELLNSSCVGRHRIP